MARPKKGATGAKPTAKAPPARPSEVRQSISDKKLKSLLASARRTKKDVDAIVGEHRAELAIAVEKHYLHKGVFAVIKRLDRMEPEKLAEWRDVFDHYWDISELDARAKSAPTLSFEEAADGGEESNVSDFPRPRAEAAE